MLLFSYREGSDAAGAVSLTSVSLFPGHFCHLKTICTFKTIYLYPLSDSLNQHTFSPCFSGKFKLTCAAVQKWKRSASCNPLFIHRINTSNRDVSSYCMWTFCLPCSLLQNIRIEDTSFSQANSFHGIHTTFSLLQVDTSHIIVYCSG